MFSFLQKVFSRSVRAGEDSEPSDASAVGTVSLRNGEECATASYSGAHVTVVNGDGGSTNANVVPMALQGIVAALPESLKSAVQVPPDSQMRANIPLPLIAGQLQRGSVRITFAELRNNSPEGVFSSSPVFDKKLINLPIQDILAHVKLAPRQKRKRVEMPDDIPGLFKSDGRTVDSRRTWTNGDSVIPAVGAPEGGEQDQEPPSYRTSDIVEHSVDEASQPLQMPETSPTDGESAEATADGGNPYLKMPTSDFNDEVSDRGDADSESGGEIAIDGPAMNARPDWTNEGEVTPVANQEGEGDCSQGGVDHTTSEMVEHSGDEENQSLQMPELAPTGSERSEVSVDAKDSEFERSDLESSDAVPDEADSASHSGEEVASDFQAMDLRLNGANAGEVGTALEAAEEDEQGRESSENRTSHFVWLSGEEKHVSTKVQEMPLAESEGARASVDGRESDLERRTSEFSDLPGGENDADLQSGDGPKLSPESGDAFDRENSENSIPSEYASESEVHSIIAPTDSGIASGPHIDVALEAVVDGFPDEIKAEVSQMGGQAVFEIPLQEIAPKMSRGRVEFSWAQLHHWIRPPLPPTAHGAVEIILPLKEIIPLFMAAHRPERSGDRKAIADEGIPDVFKKGNGSPFRVVQKPNSDSDRGVAGAEAKRGDAGSEKGSWHPRDLLEEAVSLDGVEGAVLASHDGFVVAERMPNHVDSRALAAFLPEMVGRTAEYLSKSRLGVPDWMVLQIEGRMLQISKAGELCFAVLGQTGCPLPRTKLRDILRRISLANPASK